MNSIFIWTFQDIAGLIILGILLLAFVGGLGWIGFEWLYMKTKNWWKKAK